MCSDKPLCLDHRLESSHPSLSHPGRFVTLFRAIIGVLISEMDRFRHYLAMRHRITA
jgi:hypothetical protein